MTAGNEPTADVPLTDWDAEVLLYALNHVEWADDEDIEAHTEAMREKLYAARAQLRGDG